MRSIFCEITPWRQLTLRLELQAFIGLAHSSEVFSLYHFTTAFPPMLQSLPLVRLFRSTRPSTKTHSHKDKRRPLSAFTLCLTRGVSGRGSLEYSLNCQSARQETVVIGGDRLVFPAPVVSMGRPCVHRVTSQRVHLLSATILPKLEKHINLP